MLMKFIPADTKVPFMRGRGLATILSCVLIVASLALIVTRGLNFGIDFAGGTLVEVVKPEGSAVQDVRDALSGIDGEVAVTESTTTGLDQDTVYVIRVGTSGEGEDAEAQSEQTATAVREDLEAEFGEIDVRRSETVGPKVSGELLQDGLTALGIALILMMVYITFRFEWQFGVGAVAALFHDVTLTLGMFSALQLEFNLTTIAALLTIIGYSMNDTVVVYDRVREEMRRYKKLPLEKVIDIALNGTLSRTLLTSMTTLLALLAIFFLGGEVLRGMSFALIWGVIIGTYSSVFVASTLLLIIGVDRAPVSGAPSGPDDSVADETGGLTSS